MHNSNETQNNPGPAVKNSNNCRAKRSVTITIKPLHTSVRGRARFHISALYRQESFSFHFTQQLLAIDGIVSVRANPLSASALIHHEPSLTIEELITCVTKATQRATTHIKYSKGKESNKVAVEKKTLSSSDFGEQLITLIKARIASFQAVSTPPVKQRRQGEITHVWHATPVNEAIDKLEVALQQGLTSVQVEMRLQRYGLNELPKLRARSSLGILVEQFASLPVALLSISAVISVATGGLLDAGIIMAVVFINAGIGFFTEFQAEKTISSLAKVTPRFSRVLRDGEVQEVSLAQVAIGDLLLLSPGDFVAADARVIKAQLLTVDESALTGESMPVRKSDAFVAPADTPLADRINMVHMGTMVTGGSGLAVVVATGVHTEIGKIQTMVGITRPPETPMQIQLGSMGTQLALISSAVCASVFFIGLLRGQSLFQMLKSSISLAVAAVPEGLPTVATTTLALGIRKMQQHNVAIRQLNAVETLGSVQVFCLDKTGTLTLNKMSVVAVQIGLQTVVISENQFIRNGKVVNPHNRKDYRYFLHVLALCNEIETNNHKDDSVFNGSPTENALIELAVNGGINVAALRQKFPRTKIQYRAENRPYMCTYHQLSADQQLVAVKGSPQEVLSLCGFYYKNGRLTGLTESIKRQIIAANDQMAGDALRVLGVAIAEQSADTDAKLENLVWLGLAGMIDPLRTGMPELIHIFQKAGMRTVMITGDQSATAYAIGKQLNLSGKKPLQILDSTRLDKLDPELLHGLIENVNVFARVSPAHKLQIVQALQKSGKAVAMTGDGINDGPALRAADIGVAMGGADTDIARSVADVVLEDDNLHTMVNAVHQGRAIYNNIRKSIHYLISTNLSEIEVMLAGVSLGIGQPLNPMQLLWINLVTDIFPGLALSLEPPEPDLMQRPPRERDEQIVRREDLVRMARESAFITTGSMASYAYGFLRYGPGVRANTLLFNSLTLAQLLHSYSCRSDHYSIFSKEKMPHNKYLTAAIGGSLVLQFLAMLVPGLRNLLGSTPIGIIDSLVVATGASMPLLINEATKEFTVPRLHEPKDEDEFTGVKRTKTRHKSKEVSL